MKSIIIYYSHTGNNEALAKKTAEVLDIESFPLIETKERTTKSIVSDMIWKKKSKLVNFPKNVEEYDLVIFIGPVWMYSIPTPLKSYFKYIKGKIKKYSFISVSGGSLGPNPGISKELVKRLGKGLVLNLDLNIANFCKTPQNPSTEDIGKYKLQKNKDDLNKLVEIATTSLQGISF